MSHENLRVQRLASITVSNACRSLALLQALLGEACPART